MPIGRRRSVADVAAVEHPDTGGYIQTADPAPTGVPAIL